MALSKIITIFLRLSGSANGCGGLLTAMIFMMMRKSLCSNVSNLMLHVHVILLVLYFYYTFCHDALIWGSLFCTRTHTRTKRTTLWAQESFLFWGRFLLSFLYNKQASINHQSSIDSLLSAYLFNVSSASPKYTFPPCPTTQRHARCTHPLYRVASPPLLILQSVLSTPTWLKGPIHLSLRQFEG